MQGNCSLYPWVGEWSELVPRRIDQSISEMAQRGAADGYFDEAGYDAVVVGSGYGGSVAACRLVMAGIKVCLIEKGKRWEAKDFPTSNYQMWSKGRLESDTLGFSFGPKDALFQLYEQGNSVAGVVCGLGGGLLDPPVEFASAKALKAIAEEIEESSPTPIKQTINFNFINDPGNVKGTTQLEQCVAYGNSRVLGTAQILFQSERRGLKISDRLGLGFSTNGNNFA
ncbi:hypothetical protein MRB53_016549 [Persea americana]|uniref:Uncharacterized protein n=1 Tax=Persea americana TaxID=3435 RepID=A0ACC2M2M3_PERAE|nr:hypothetical protein MRB53_016549 [Persea americana]